MKPDQSVGRLEPFARRPSCQQPTFTEAFRFWLKLGFISFGGPTGQIAIMQTELVDKKRWISETRFLHALNYCMLLPGPEAQQLAIYIGWLLHRTKGGIVAGTLFVLPSALLLWALSYIYVTYGSLPWVAALFYGVKPVVMAIVAGAIWKLGRKVLKNSITWIVAIASFIGIYFLNVPFPLIILSAALTGLLSHRFFPHSPLERSADANGDAFLLPDNGESPIHTRPSWARAMKILLVGLFLWWAPVALVAALFGTSSTLFTEGLFFSKTAVITFGGAYAVLPYVAQHSVESFLWLRPDQMIDGLALAESTPGPLIMILQFVGFMGGWNHPGTLTPLLAATLGAALTTWVTFIPSFIAILLGGPSIEQLRGNSTLSVTLSVVTAAVVGVILNLTVKFSTLIIHPAPGVIDPFSTGLALVALLGIVRWQWGVIPLLTGGAAAGLLYHML